MQTLQKHHIVSMLCRGLSHPLACSTHQLDQLQRLHLHCSISGAQQRRVGTFAAKAGRKKIATGSQDDNDDEGLPPESTVSMEKKDISIKELADKVKDGELDLQPSYQRGLVWDRKMASRLVVTALENRVVPTIYLEQDDDGNYLVMDGKQRLASLIAFYTGDERIGNLHWSAAPTTLQITDDTSCDIRWHSTTFASLPEKRQKLFKNYSLMCVIINSSTDRDVVFNIYQDINTGAVGHTEQQSRKAAFHGPYVELLDTLALDQHFLKIQRREKPDSEKESDRELALRFFAMWRNADRFKTPMLQFLNREIKEHQKATPAEVAELQQLFTTTTATVWQIWGDMACRDTSGAKARADVLNPSLWDAVMVAVCKELELSKQRRKELVLKSDAIRQGYLELVADPVFRKCLSSTSKQNVQRRIAMMRDMLQRVAPESHDKVRAFKRDVKLLLWDTAVADQGVVLCADCNQSSTQLMMLRWTTSFHTHGVEALRWTTRSSCTGSATGQRQPCCVTLMTVSRRQSKPTAGPVPTSAAQRCTSLLQAAQNVQQQSIEWGIETHIATHVCRRVD